MPHGFGVERVLSAEFGDLAKGSADRPGAFSGSGRIKSAFAGNDFGGAAGQAPNYGDASIFPIIGRNPRVGLARVQLAHGKDWPECLHGRMDG